MFKVGKWGTKQFDNDWMDRHCRYTDLMFLHNLKTVCQQLFQRQFSGKTILVDKLKTKALPLNHIVVEINVKITIMQFFCADFSIFISGFPKILTRFVQPF